MINEKKAFQEFLNAENGDFCGFDFANEFHVHFDKSTALYTAVADDCNDFFDFCNRTIRQYNENYRRRSAC